MNNMIMANIDGGVEKLAFETRGIERIIHRYIIKFKNMVLILY